MIHATHNYILQTSKKKPHFSVDGHAWNRKVRLANMVSIQPRGMLIVTYPIGVKVGDAVIPLVHDSTRPVAAWNFSLFQVHREDQQVDVEYARAGTTHLFEYLPAHELLELTVIVHTVTAVTSFHKVTCNRALAAVGHFRHHGINTAVSRSLASI